MSIKLVAQDSWRFQLAATQPTTLTFDFTWSNSSTLEAPRSLGSVFRGLQPAALDCDLAVLLLNAQTKLPTPAAFISFATPISACKSVRHLSDNLTGTNAANKQERLQVCFDTLPTWVESLVFVVSIYEAAKRHQDFSQIQNACLLVSPVDHKPWLSLCLPKFETPITYLHLLKLTRQDNNSWLLQVLLEPLPITTLPELLKIYTPATT